MPSRRGGTLAYVDSMVAVITADLVPGEKADGLVLLWSQLVELLEANCLPGVEAHPEVAALYDRFVLWTNDIEVLDADGYAAWLVGRAPDDLSEFQRRIHLRRWSKRLP
ncbi:hypothetical protein [Mycolicibacterium iranicum]|uniref:Uncharacterized protein n=1 Tax=Mycolicibacterium iranicum TaxID=912594 RepID=A0ABT4HLC0_MYCIR|nr:hypothetical protein [Mycolicibacterium iranicum]MCZ0730574.1 hypothetical protein [Mycolicibacterium iranicum]